MLLKFEIDSNILVKDFLEGKLTKALQRTLSNTSVNYIVNDQCVKNYYEMKKGDLLTVVIPPVSSNIIPKKAELDILYEDDYLLIINKPHNIASIPTRKHYENSLANIVQYYYVTKGINAGMHFVNRLDHPTSGIIVVAKNTYIADCMKTSIKEKKYLLKVHGLIDSDGSIRTNIVKDENSIIKRKNIPGTNAYTTYKVVKQLDGQTIIEGTLHTGKTHQLRLHFNYLNHPIIGDSLYGEKDNDNELLYLHSYYLKFIHPVTLKEIEIINWPKWFS